MGAVVQEADRRGRKSVNAELDVVPFIGLLACVIAFLLTTAIWKQYPALDTSMFPTRPLPESFAAIDAPEPLQLVMDDGRYELRVGSLLKFVDRGTAGFSPTGLDRTLAELRSVGVETRTVRIKASDEVAFDDLAGTMDLLNARGWTEVQILPVL